MAEEASNDRHLKLAQEAFAEWLESIDDLLEDGLLSHEEALGHLAHADGKAFGFALGVMAGKMDQARQEIAGALKRLRDPEEKRL